MLHEKGYRPESEAENQAEEQSGKKQISRRGFLKMAGATLAGLALSPKAEAGIRTVKAGIGADVEFKPDLKDQIIAKELPGEDEVLAVPEYDRTMERVLISIPTADKDKGTESGPVSIRPYLKNLYADLLSHLPDYSQIEIIVSPADRQRTEKMIAELGLENRVTYRQIAAELGRVEEWAQDLGEAVTINGQEKFIRPVSMRIKDRPKLNERVAKRNQSIDQAFGPDEVIQAQFYFEGGNIAFDRTENGLRVFIGCDDLTDTQYYYQDFGINKSLKEIAKMISEQFGAAEVVVMGQGRQPEEMFHIDQSFVILADKQAVVNRVNERSEAADNQEYMQAQLKALGYQISNIDATSDDLAKSYSSTNAIPFVDKNSGERKIIFPVFPTEVAGDYNKTEEITPEILRGKGLQAYEVYKNLGYTPVPVRDFSHLYKGNTHCISNVLAKLESHPSSEVMA